MNTASAKKFLKLRMQESCTIRTNHARSRISHRGYEIRLYASNPEEELLLRTALKALDIQAGASYSKGSGKVIPCYGYKTVVNLLNLMNNERAREALQHLDLDLPKTKCRVSKT